ncbi:MAG: TetR/AcrR family transcriptional regulator [Pseudomonadales bacterium]
MPNSAPPDLTTRKTPSQARSRERVELILEATRELLREKGFPDITTNAIARQASIPVSSVYQYFPNKQAILVALYEDYLARILTIYDRLDQPEYLSLGWRKFFRQLALETVKLEEQDAIEDELSRAFTLIPELREIELLHADRTAERLAGLMRKLGSRWQMRRLKRLAQFIYALHNGVWIYRSELQPPAREVFDWEFKAVEALLADCFGAPADKEHID